MLFLIRELQGEGFMRFWVCVIGLGFILSALPAAAKQQGGFNDWMTSFRQEAIAKHGIRPDVLDSVFPKDFQPIPKIVELDRKQPEKTKSFEVYLKAIVTHARVKEAQVRASDSRLLLQDTGKEFQVDPEFIVALWSVETNFGKNTGGYSIPRALATLAYDGRRSEYFRTELIKSLKIIQESHVKAENFKGSWAGAMGQIQFMPSSFERFAVDKNGDGRRDIWETKEDIFASAANYLSRSGWRKGEPWGHEVILPRDFDRSHIGTDKQYSQAFWNKLGVRLNNGLPLPIHGGKGALIQPDGPDTRAFIVYENFRTILKWNRSVYFATSVGLLADAARKGLEQPAAAGLNR
jgi:membrane-bound lytic murein transglycosylase B